MSHTSWRPQGIPPSLGGSYMVFVVLSYISKMLRTVSPMGSDYCTSFPALSIIRL
ncbi:hypothetical protein CPB83DRAFT_855329 [Crepidotus variabilis]|uniref:Uncharacterized protein n=1 Tax=Crepidotus variabilis TaxID=179855 RepID=A0A9P6JP71_9AGAR|nr:hypothetical protein CPB83DRAFT_855329 [Crepidotus variabilis]